MKTLTTVLALTLVAAAAAVADGHTSEAPPPVGPDYEKNPPASADAALTDARTYFDEGSYTWALAAAEELQKRWPDSAARAEGDLVALRCYLQLEMWPEADEGLAAYFKRHKKSVWAADAADLLVDAYSETRHVYDGWGWQSYLGEKYGFYIYGDEDDLAKFDKLRRDALKQAKSVYRGLIKRAAGDERAYLADRLVADYLIMYPYFYWDRAGDEPERGYGRRASYLGDVGRLEMSDGMRSIFAVEEALLELGYLPADEEAWEAADLDPDEYDRWLQERRFAAGRAKLEEIAASYGDAPGALLARAALAHYDVTFLDEPARAATAFDELADSLDNEVYAELNRRYARHLREPALALLHVDADPAKTPPVSVELACRIFPEVELKVYDVDPAKYLELRRELDAVEAVAEVGAEAEGQGVGVVEEYRPVPTAQLPGVRGEVVSWTVATGCTADDYHVKTVLATRDDLAPGLYAVEARAGDDLSRAMFLLTGAAALTATDNEELFLQLVDAQTGAPTALGEMWAYNIYYKPDERGYNKEVVDAVAADAAPRGDGVLIDLTGFEKSSTAFFVLESALGPVVYSCDTAWQVRDRDAVTGTVITDRPLYRPGDKVSFKGIVRRVDYVEKVLAPLAGQEVDVVVTSPDGQEVWKDKAVTDEFGTVAGELELPAGVRLGRQTLHLKWEEGEKKYDVSGTFDLEEYEKPEYEVVATAAKDRYFSGEKVELDVVGSYYFGAPMAGAELSYQIYRQGYTPDEYEYDKLIKKGGGVLDAEGKFRLAFDTPWAKRYDNYFTIYLKVTDVSERVVEETAYVSTYKTDRFVSLSADKYDYRPGETVKVDLWTDDWYDEPVSAEVEIEAYEYLWDSERGYYRGDVLYEARAVTDVDGHAVVEFELAEPPDEVEVVARVKGTNGADYETSTTVEFVAGAVETTVRKPEIGITVSDNYPTLGDDVDVALESRFDEAECLITIYSGRVVGVKHVKLEPAELGSSATFTLEADDAMVPSCTLYAAVVKDGASWTDNDSLYITNTNVRMEVEVKTGRDVYRPRDEATVTVACVDPGGLPVKADVSLAAVDASLLALRPDRTYAVPSTFESALGRYGYMQQNNSLGDRGFVGRAVFWFPYYPYYYDAYGAAFLPEDVERWGPAARMLERIYFPTFVKPALDPYFQIADADLLGREVAYYRAWGDRGIGLVDSLSRTAYRGGGVGAGGGYGMAGEATTTEGEVYFAEPAAAPPAEAKMARKEVTGKDKGGEFVQAEVREEFADTAVWLPNVRTSDAGDAEASFALPDNLTEWRLMALALDRGQRFGWGSSSFDVNKFVIARLKAPRYFVAGDVARLTAIGHNYLKEAKELKLAVEEEGLVGVRGEASTTEEVPPDGKAVLYRWVEAPAAGEARLKTSALTDVESDAAAFTLPVYPHGTQIRQAFGGRLRKEVSHELTVADGMVPDTFAGELYVTPSLAATLSHGLDFFKEYPYDCVEQTLNRFRMNALLAAAAADLGLERSKLAEGLTEAVDEGVARLAEQQTAEGGWPWWKGGRESPYMTAYAVDGLGTLRGNPFLSANAAAKVEEMYAGGEKYLAGYVADWRENRDRYPAALSLYVFDVALRTGMLAADDEAAAEMADYYFEYRSPHSHMSLALLASALHQLGDEQRLAVILRNLDNGAKVGRDNTLHWGEEPENCWRWWDDGVETTAKVLDVKLAYQADSPQLPYIVDWLVDQRRGASWKSTKDSAAATTALIRYILARPELAAPIVVAYRAGKAEGGMELDPAAYEAPGEAVSFTPDEFAAGENEMSLTRTSGEGPAFYTMSVEYYAEGKDLPAVQGSVTLEREFYIIKKEFKRGKLKEKRLPLNRPLELGEELEVELTINSPYDFDYVVLEDPKAAGLIYLETRSGYSWPLNAYVELWNKQRNVFFERLAAGETVVTYRLRAEVPGEYAALPARIYGMYSPDIGSNTASSRLKVADK
jgi:uncharacterized protein YfaS (alpha-2-macroglobulin family)